MSGVLRAPRNPLRQGELPCTRELLPQFLFFSYYGYLRVDGVSVAHRYQTIYPPLGFDFSPGVRVLTAPSPSSADVVRWCPVSLAASVHRKSLGTEPPFPVAQALVFAIGAVTRIELFADHFTARCGRRGYLPLAAAADVIGSAVLLAADGKREGGSTAISLGVGPCSSGCVSVCHRHVLRRLQNARCQCIL